MSAGGCEESGWDAGQHDLAQDELKGLQAGCELGLPCSSEKCRGIECRVPRLH